MSEIMTAICKSSRRHLPCRTVGGMVNANSNPVCVLMAKLGEKNRLVDDKKPRLVRLWEIKYISRMHNSLFDL